jgi:hypothetical protein
MRLVLSAVIGLAAIGCAFANDPCADYRRLLSYSRTADPTPVTLILDEEKTGAEIELQLPRSFTAIRGNLSDGRQCKISLELMWPELAPGGAVPDGRRRVRDRLLGDFPAWRALTIDVSIERKPALPWAVPGVYCRARERLTEMADRPFGLRAFDDRIRWPSHRQLDGSYRSMQELVGYPLNSANVFYAIDEAKVEDMVRIRCSKGAPRCGLESQFRDFRTTTLFNGEDLENWRRYRDAVRDFLEQHLIRSVPAQQFPEPGLSINPSPTRVACMRDQAVQGRVNAETLRRMGLDR